MFLALAQKVLDYLTRIDDQKNMPKIALRLVEHFYFKVQGDRGSTCMGRAACSAAWVEMVHSRG